MFDNLFDSMEIIENLLSFENFSSEFSRNIKTKLLNQLTKVILPNIISCLTSPMKNVKKFKFLIQKN